MLPKYEPELFPTLTSNPNLGNTWVMFSLISNNSIIVYASTIIFSIFDSTVLDAFHPHLLFKQLFLEIFY